MFNKQNVEKKMKKKFESPVMRFVKIDNTDVICTSGECPQDASGGVCYEDDNCLRDF